MILDRIFVGINSININGVSFNVWQWMIVTLHSVRYSSCNQGYDHIVGNTDNEAIIMQWDRCYNGSKPKGL